MIEHCSEGGQIVLLSHFHFSDIQCPTDSRKRPDIRRLEEGNVSENNNFFQDTFLSPMHLSRDGLIFLAQLV